jgi:hypothetical protein
MRQNSSGAYGPKSKRKSERAVSESKDAKKQQRRKPRKKGGYVPRSNAVHITLYDPTGGNLKPEVVEEIEKVVTDKALENKLLVGLART